MANNYYKRLDGIIVSVIIESTRRVIQYETMNTSITGYQQDYNVLDDVSLTILVGCIYAG